MSEATSPIDVITDEDGDMIDLTKSRGLDFPSDNGTDDTIVSEELAETFCASKAQHRSWMLRAFLLPRLLMLCRF